jgi:hypothetical protein
MAQDLEADNSKLHKTGHFYFALTRSASMVQILFVTHVRQRLRYFGTFAAPISSLLIGAM